jgi:drug/metabolite transporter (DMT)-like permease
VTRTYAAFAFLCIVFGTTFGAIKIEMAEHWPPLLSAGLRFTIGGSLVLGLAALRRELRPLRRADVGGLVAVGSTVTAATFGVLYSAERVLPSGVCALLSATSPLFAVALAVAAKRRRFDRFAATGIVLGTAGVALVAGVGAVSGPAAIVAAAAIIVSEFGFAWGLGRARSVAATVPMLQFAGTQQLIGGCVLLVLSAAVEHRGIAASRLGVASFVYLVLVGTAAAHTVAIWLAAKTNATFASSWTYISPFIALAFGAILLDETFAVSAWIGGVCVIGGAVAINYAPVPRRAQAAGNGS